MTEKIESMEIHPMRGHSRGEWYCTLDDIAPSEEEAEYWAIFGVTHRGNKHCLGEYPTKSAAKTAAHGLKDLRKPTGPSLSKRGKQIIQIELVAAEGDSTMVDIFALCNDGSIWRRGIGTGRHSGLIDDHWERIPLDGIEDLAPEAAFGMVIAASR
jgi:hypothetical protein